jgi:hypothetical protein
MRIYINILKISEDIEFKPAMEVQGLQSIMDILKSDWTI